MKNYLRHLSFWLIFLLFFLIIYINSSDLLFDNYGSKVLSGKKESIILGISRANMGICPSTLKNILKKDFFNYAFDIYSSPYGPLYFNSIKNKINDDNYDNIYILSVSPWSIASKSKNPNDSTQFRENNEILKNKYNNTIIGKLDFFFNEYGGNLISLSYNFTNRSVENGQLRIKDKLSLNDYNSKRKAKIQTYKKRLNFFKFSSLRLNYLNETIKLLKNHGKVFLVKLPIDNVFEKEVERKLIVDFDYKIDSLATINEISYLSLQSKNHLYDYLDGHHLIYNSSESVTDSIAIWIKKQSD